MLRHWSSERFPKLDATLAARYRIDSKVSDEEPVPAGEEEHAAKMWQIYANEVYVGSSGVGVLHRIHPRDQPRRSKS